MKKLLLTLIALVAVVSSCNKDTAANNDEYYVRYEGNITTLHIVERSYSVATETGEQTFTTMENTFSRTFGPVRKGFNASISLSCNEDPVYIKSCSVHIEVSKNNGPFALKASGDNKASYRIDF